MKRLATVALLLLLLVAVLPFQTAHASSLPQVKVTGFYDLNVYGFAVVNETVSIANNQTSAMSIPTVQLGLGNLSSLVVNTVINGAGFSLSSNTPGGPFTVTSSTQLAPGNSASFTLSSLLSGEVTTAVNGSNRILTLLRPSINLPVQTLKQAIITPTGTKFGGTPKGFTYATPSGSNYTYTMTATAVPAGAAQTADPYMSTSSGGSFFPVFVYQAIRTISVGLNGAPTVTDQLTLKNEGTQAISSLPLAPLALSNAQVTVIPSSEPKLLNPTTVALVADTLNMGAVLGSAWSPDSNLTVTFQYQLNQKYFSTSGSQVTVTIPNVPPMLNVVESYAIEISTPTGISVVQGQPQTITEASQRQTGSWTLTYAVALGWAIDGGVPAAALIFILLFLGLFVVRGGGVQEEENEEESSGERVEAMIKAFDEKTSLINSLWPEISGMDPNELKKEYFDELRGRLDSFRSRALTRLNEVKQKSTTQKFFDLLNQIHTTEREVDRAAKDKLNLYEQFYMRRMRKEVFDRLLPQYTRRLEKGLNELSDELHVVQKEAKLL